MENQAPTDPEAVRLELQEALVSFRQVGTFFVQLIGFLTAADSLLLGYGFAQRQSGILLVASLMPLLIIIAGVYVVKAAIPVAYVAMVLEQELGLRRAPLATVILWRVFRHTLPMDASSIDLADHDFQKSLLQSPTRFVLTHKAAYTMYAAFVAQVGLFLIATSVVNFRFM